MTGEEFEKLQRGDVVKNELNGDLYVVHQVRLAAFYVVFRCDEKTLEPVQATSPLALRSGENLVIHRKATAR